MSWRLKAQTAIINALCACPHDATPEAKLKAMATKENVKNTILSIDNPAGPERYKISKDADITVLLYTGRVVKANHAFKGALKDADIEKITGDISKITK